ncbi:fibronectin type III domain-containing protein [Streptosporangium sp. NPDC048865]|uniref:fibronectin type III domain-containing protein n=1 Tax=Streptosporangium sp. NPDC048865 TaxID=3155766 RepID=UPI003419E37E
MSTIRQRKSYTASVVSGGHTISFSSILPQSRIVIFVHSYAGVSGRSSGYDEHEWSAHTLGIRMYSRLSYGGETTFGVSTSDPTDRLFMWMFEVTNAPHFYGSSSSTTSGSAVLSIGGLPAGCVALLGVSQYVTGSDNAALSWPSGFSGNGVVFKNWNDGLAKQVFASSADDESASGSVSFAQRLISLNSKEYAWAGGVFGPSPDEEPPTAPTNLRVTGQTNTSVTVAWSAATDSGTGVSGYGVYRDGTKVGFDDSDLSATITGLTAGQTYVVEVDAVDGNGNRGEKTSISVTVIADTTPPTVPGNLRITALGSGSFTCAWDASTDNIGVVGYGVYRNGSKVGADQTALTKSFSGLGAGTTHTFAVDAVDMHGNRSAKATLSGVIASPDVVAPTVPGNLRTTAVSGASIAIAWDASTDDRIGLAGYGVYKDGTKVADLVAAAASYRFNALTADTEYLLQVDAVDRAGNRSAKAGLSVVAVTETVPPTTPGDLGVTGATHTTISLTWSASTDNDEVIRYDVLVDGVRRGDTAGLAFTVQELTPNTTYVVAVRAVDRSGNVSELVEVVAATAEPPYMQVASPVYLLAGWAGNVVDDEGVVWTVEEEEGWSSSPNATGLGDDNDGDDGGFAGPGQFGPKVITLAGLAVAPDHLRMAQAMDQLVSILHPRQLAELRVVEEHMTRRVMVRLSNDVTITPRGARAFNWEFTVTADDPRRMGVPIRQEASGEAPDPIEVVVEVYGDYPDGIPAALTIQDAISAPRLLHVETGVEITFDPDVLIEPGYTVRVDLLARDVTVFNPTLPAGEQTSSGMRSMIASSTWFQLVNGPNTIRLLGQSHPTTPGPATLVVETADCWT